MFITANQVNLQSQQTNFAKIQAENSITQQEMSQEQALLKKTQDEHNQVLHGISIHPSRYTFELKIEESGNLLPGQSIEIINGSERIATEISAYWEIVGTDYGNPEGWGKREEIEFEKQTLRPLEEMTVKAFPSQLSMIASPDNKSKAIEYYGHLRISFSDSRVKQIKGNSYLMSVHHDKQKKVLVMQFAPEDEQHWIKVDLDKNQEIKIMEPRE